RDVLRERAPVREARLELVIAHLLIPGPTGPASAACADEGHRDPVAHTPPSDLLACGNDFSGELMARNVGYANVCVVSHPAMPVATAKSGRFDGDDHSIVRRYGISD